MFEYFSVLLVTPRWTFSFAKALNSGSDFTSAYKSAKLRFDMHLTRLHTFTVSLPQTLNTLLLAHTSPSVSSRCSPSSDLAVERLHRRWI